MQLLKFAALPAVAMSFDLMDVWQGAMEKVQENPGPSQRNVMELFTLTNLFNYGCWCHFGDSRPVRGAAMDEVDGMCQTWYWSKDCIGIDLGPECDLNMQYVDVLTELDFPFDPTHDYDALCVSFNAGDECAQQNCMTDAYFLRSIFNHMAFNHMNDSMSTDFGFNTDVCKNLDSKLGVDGTTEGPFTTAAPGPDATTVAGATTAPPQPSHACCGSFPNRFPFKLKNGERACCNDKTYATHLLECCAADQSLALIGTC
jgi:hypothetical protein